MDVELIERVFFQRHISELQEASGLNALDIALLEISMLEAENQKTQIARLRSPS